MMTRKVLVRGGQSSYPPGGCMFKVVVDVLGNLASCNGTHMSGIFVDIHSRLRVDFKKSLTKHVHSTNDSNSRFLTRSSRNRSSQLHSLKSPKKYVRFPNKYLQQIYEHTQLQVHNGER